jgi:hypothetical protein
MKRVFILIAVGLSAITLLSGCVLLKFGGGEKKEVKKATAGQQLIDLKKAHDAGAISNEEYEAQKAKVLSGQ